MRFSRVQTTNLGSKALFPQCQASKQCAVMSPESFKQEMKTTNLCPDVDGRWVGGAHVVCVAGLDVGELLGHLGEYNRLVLLRVLLQDVDHALVPRLCRVRPRPVCDCELQGSASSLTAHTRENVGGMCTCVYAREREPAGASVNTVGSHPSPCSIRKFCAQWMAGVAMTVLR